MIHRIGRAVYSDVAAVRHTVPLIGQFTLRSFFYTRGQLRGRFAAICLVGHIISIIESDGRGCAYLRVNADIADEALCEQRYLLCVALI